MVKESIIRALLAGFFYILLIWLGDVYIFNQDTPLYIYPIQFLIFTVLMAVVYYFSLKKHNNKNK